MSRIESVILGRDPDVLRAALPFYVRHGRIVDLTANRRRMWQGVPWDDVVYCDIDPGMHPDIICDWGEVPLPDQCAVGVVFDPPHLPSAAASAKSMAQMGEDYGLAFSCGGDNILAALAPAMKSASRLLVDGGVLICKIKDYVHNHRYQWVLMGLHQIAAASGFTPCDLLIKIDPAGGHLKSGRWKTAHHARNTHCYFPVYRKGTRCESKEGIPL